jgi:Flp pilus assembly pilin Flp
MIRNFLRDESGQTATEYMLIVSVIVVAVVAAAYLFIDPFRAGVEELAADVSTILDSGKIGAGMGIGHS